MKYYYAVEILRVVDGDTVDVRIDLGFDVWHKCRVRLMGINAPESRTRDKEDAVDPIELKSHGKGKFGRILGEFFINGKNINQLMVDNGHAVEYFGGKR